MMVAGPSHQAAGRRSDLVGVVGIADAKSQALRVKPDDNILVKVVVSVRHDRHLARYYIVSTQSAAMTRAVSCR
jgi:hypothetical protein